MAHVQDIWMRPGPNGRKVRTKHWGRGKRWQVRWIENGAERTKMYAAKDVADARVAELELGIVRPVWSTVTVAEYAEDWLSQQLHYADNSAESAKWRISAHIVPALGDLRLAEVTRLDVQRAVVGWAQEMKPNTVRQVVSFVRSIFRTAAEDGLIPATPCVRLNVPDKVRNPIVPVTAEQVATVADRMPPRYRAMVILGATSGLRPSELAGLTIDRLVAGDVVVSRQLIRVVAGGGPVFGPPKTAASNRRIAVGNMAHGVLAEHVAAFPPGQDGLLFTTREHGAIRKTRMAYLWRTAVAGMGLRPRSGWHELRHYHASVLIHAGRSPKAVAARLGHADASETLRTYAHLWPSDEAGLVAVVEADLSPYISVTALPELLVSA